MPKVPKDMDLHNMAWIISSLDMAIYGNPVRLDYVGKILKNYEKKYEEINYEKVMTSLKNIEKIMLDRIYTKSIRKRLKMLNYGTRIFLIFAIAVAFISFLFEMFWLFTLFYSFFIAALFLLIVNYLMLKSLDKRIENLHSDDYMMEKEYIWNVNQYLIDLLSKKIREKSANPKEYRIPLKSEYKNIEIVSRSSFLRKYYIGIVKAQP